MGLLPGLLAEEWRLGSESVRGGCSSCAHHHPKLNQRVLRGRKREQGAPHQEEVRAAGPQPHGLPEVLRGVKGDLVWLRSCDLREETGVWGEQESGVRESRSESPWRGGGWREAPPLSAAVVAATGLTSQCRVPRKANSPGPDFG